MKVLASKQANIINSAPNSVASPSFANNPANIFQNQQQPSGNIFGSRPPFFEP